MSTPNEILAERVIERLLSEGLIVEGDARTMRQALLEGTLDSADWRLALEKGLEREVKP